VERLSTWLRGLQRRAIHKENIGPAVIVVIENRDSTAHRLDEVFTRRRGIVKTEVQARGQRGLGVFWRRFCVKGADSGRQEGDAKDASSDASHRVPIRRA